MVCGTMAISNLSIFQSVSVRKILFQYFIRTSFTIFIRQYVQSFLIQTGEQSYYGNCSEIKT